MIALKTLASLIAGGTLLVGAPVSYAASQNAGGSAEGRTEVVVEAGPSQVPQPELPAAPAAPAAPAVPQTPKLRQVPKAPKVATPDAPSVPKTPEVPTAALPAASIPQAQATGGGGSAAVTLPSASVGLGN